MSISPIPPKEIQIIEIKAPDHDECRAAYIDLLAAMLSDANPSATGSRLDLVREFGGTATWESLGKMASKDARLRDLMQKMSAVERVSQPGRGGT